MNIWPFIQRPGLVANVALVFVACFVAARWSKRRSTTWPLLLAALAWAAYAGWEWHCTARQYNIRIDLLVIPWILIPITVLAIWNLISGRNPFGVE